jgi:glycerophosphoryl diester phosphodiesterase
VDGDGIPDTTYQDLASLEIFEQIGEDYAEGVGPWKNSFILRESIETPVDGNGDGEAEITTQLTGEVRPFVEWARQAEMQIHPYTLRNEERFLTLEPDGSPQTPGEEFEQLIALGVDGFFTDFPATGSTIVETIVEEPNLPRSRGFEGMAFSPDRATAYPLLEGPVDGDPENSRRIYEFDLESGEYQGIIGFYGTEEPSHAIGDFTPINENEFLVIERDGSQADPDGFKKVFKIDFSDIDEEGFVAKEEVVDLLNIPDPDDLNDDGETTYTMPFVTIEDVLVIDENTILVANDNNYPFSVGRPPEIDNNEIALIELEEPLDLDPRLGANAEELAQDSALVFGNLEGNILDSALGGDEFDGLADLFFAGAGDDTIDTSAGSDNRIYAGGDVDEVFVGTNDRLFGGEGNDFLDASEGGGNNRLYGGRGNDRLLGGNEDRLIGNEGDDQFFFPNGGANNIVTGGAGADRFQIKDPDVRLGTNTITDFISGEDTIAIAGVEATFADITRTATDEGTLLSLQGEDLAILLGVDANSLSATDFTFASL